MSRNEIDWSRQEREKTYSQCISARHCCKYPEEGARPVSILVPLLLYCDYSNIATLLHYARRVSSQPQPWLIDRETCEASRLMMIS